MNKKDKSNKWLKNDTAYIDKYLHDADIVLVERYHTAKILVDLFSYHFNDKNSLNILDLGCGDGFLTQNIIKRYPDNMFYLLDGSKDMIKKAKETLKNDNLTFINQTFEEYIEQPDSKNKYHFVCSSNAIHHLNFKMKQRLFDKIYHELRPKGLFINIDTVKPSSERSESWQFKMWADWMNETLLSHNLKEKIGKYNDLPSVYKNKEENKPDTLISQLDSLKDTGFNDVDCFYKYGIFSMYGGTK